MLEGVVQVTSLGSSDSEAEDERLLRRYLDQGDRAAAGTLLARHTDLAYRVALRFLRNASDAEDVAQAACLAVLRQARQYREGVSVRTWLAHIVIGLCKNRRREETDGVFAFRLQPSRQ